MALRDLRALWRQPWYVVATLVQPVIWLLLFGELFKRVADLPGFGDESYIAYLAPGVVIMSALFSSGWNGMATIEDINRGVTDRLLVSPVRRGAIIAGRVPQSAVVIVDPVRDHGRLALAVGASFPGGVVGVLVLILVSALLGAALRDALELAGADDAPGGVADRRRHAARPAADVPVDGADDERPAARLDEDGVRREPGRLGDRGRPQRHRRHADWGLVARDLGLLALLLVVCATLATRAFRSYQRSI